MKKLFSMIKYLFPIAVVSLAACTYSITQVHTQGQASDVVDETTTPSTTVTPTVNVPISPTGK